MSSPLRVRIQYKDSRNKYAVTCKFVYLINSPTTTTISQLVSLLQEFMGAQFGMESLRLTQLNTDDGCLLMKDDVCAHVLISNEQLVCMDMSQFIVNHLGSLNIAEAWFTLEHQDGSEDVPKKLVVGMSTRRQAYVYLFGNDDDRALFLFNATDLLRLALHERNGKHVTIRDQSNFYCSLDVNVPAMKISGATPSNWFISAEWESSGSGETLFLLGQLKADETSEIHKGRVRLDLNRKHTTIEHWEVMQLSHPTQADDFPTEIEPARLNELKSTIPPLKRTGPVLDTSVITNKLQIYESQGDSAIQMMQGTGSSVEMTQQYYSRNGSFRQFVSITHIIISKKQTVLPETLTQTQTQPVERAISVARINVQYQQSDGEWLDCEEAHLVLTDGGYKLASSILNIEPDKLISVSVETTITVKGEPNRDSITRDRGHRSFPQPLKLKIIITDNVSKTCSLMVEQLNKPLVLITKERFLEREKSNVKNLIVFIDADDCQFDERIFVSVYINMEDSLVITNGSTSVHMKESHVRSNQIKAKKSRKCEELVDYMNDSNTKVVSLFDPETFLFYAIRIELTTSTSQTIETVFVPLEEIK